MAGDGGGWLVEVAGGGGGLVAKGGGGLPAAGGGRPLWDEPAGVSDWLLAGGRGGPAVAGGKRRRWRLQQEVLVGQWPEMEEGPPQWFSPPPPFFQHVESVRHRHKAT